MLVVQQVDLSDDHWLDFANLGDRHRAFEHKSPRGATPQAHMRDDFVGFEKRHIFDEQPQHPLSLTRREFGVGPDAREVGGQG